ncbi:hypothetical protein FQZ97_283150 [compost metagenome]
MPIKDIGFIAVALEAAENFLALLGRKRTVRAPELDGLVGAAPHIRDNGRQHAASASDGKRDSQPSRSPAQPFAPVNPLKKQGCLRQLQISLGVRPANCVMVGPTHPLPTKLTV